MTTGSGLSISQFEKDPTKQNIAIQQLIEGRSNAVGTVTLAHDGAATTTTVAAPTCGPNSIVSLAPQTAHAAAALATTYVLATNISPAQFIITHAATSQTDQTYWWLAIG